MSSCATCNKDYNKQFSETKECSHVSCPYRRKAWSDGINVRTYTPVKPERQTTPTVDKEFK